MTNETNKKVTYNKPVVLATTKNGRNFSAGCPTNSGWRCKECRCS